MVTKEEITELVFQLSAIFPAWNNAIQTTEQANNLKRVWYAHLNDMGLTKEDLMTGLKKARMQESGFLPSLGQFASWCQSSSAPTKHQAWQIATTAQSTSQIKSPEIYEAVKRTGHFDMKNRDEKTMKPLFFDHYADVLRERSEGVRFALPAPESQKEPERIAPTEADKIKGREVMNRLLGALDEGMKP